MGHLHPGFSYYNIKANIFLIDLYCVFTLMFDHLYYTWFFSTLIIQSIGQTKVKILIHLWFYIFFLFNNETTTCAFNNITFYKLWFTIMYEYRVYIILKRHTWYSGTTVVAWCITSWVTNIKKNKSSIVLTSPIYLKHFTMVNALLLSPP